MSQYYGQKNFLQKIGIIDGDRNYRIDQTGCLLITICNYEKWKKGVDVNPLDLNRFYVDNRLYVDAAPKDGLYDDLSWNSLTQYDPAETILNAGSGSPSIDGSFVEFRYNSVHTGEPISHFCLMIDAANGVIIDGYDGLIKNRDQYEHVYGKPTAYCAYIDNLPIQIVPSRADNHPSNGYQPGKKLFLPAAASLWRVYPLDRTPVVGNEVGKLAPGNPDFAPGLTYEIVSTTQWANVFTIHTNAFGNVNIYAGPDTIAEWVDSAPALVAPVQSSAVVEPVAVAPEPSVVATPVAQTEPAQTEISVAETVPVKVIPADPKKWQKSYKDFLHPQQYTAIQSIVIRDLDGNNEPQQLVKGEPYLIVGDFTWTDGSEYYLSEKSKKAGIWYGIPKSALKKQTIREDDELFLKMEEANAKEIIVRNLKNPSVNTIKKAGTFAGLVASLFVKLRIIKIKKET